MATIDLTKRSAAYPLSTSTLAGSSKTISVTFDAAKAAAAKGSALAANDVINLLNVPAGSFLLTLSHKVKTVEGGTFTYSIGDTTTPAGFVSAANGNTSVDASSFNGTTTPAYGVGKYYSATTPIGLTIASGTPAAAVVSITATFLVVKHAEG